MMDRMWSGEERKGKERLWRIRDGLRNPLELKVIDNQTDAWMKRRMCTDGLEEALLSC